MEPLVEMAEMDPNWFLSALMQSSATIVAIVAGFLINALVNKINQKEETLKKFQQKKYDYNSVNINLESIVQDWVQSHFVRNYLGYEFISTAVYGNFVLRQDEVIDTKTMVVKDKFQTLIKYTVELIQNLHMSMKELYEHRNFSENTFSVFNLNDEYLASLYFTPEQVQCLARLVCFTELRKRHQKNYEVNYESQLISVGNLIDSQVRMLQNSVQSQKDLEEKKTELSNQKIEKYDELEIAASKYKDSLDLKFLTVGAVTLSIIMLLGFVLPATLMIAYYTGKHFEYKWYLEIVIVAICVSFFCFSVWIVKYIKDDQLTKDKALNN